MRADDSLPQGKYFQNKTHDLGPISICEIYMYLFPFFKQSLAHTLLSFDILLPV